MELVPMQTLFNLFGVECPSWLEGVEIEGDWLNSEYVYENRTHTWEFKETDHGYLVRHLVLVFNGAECTLSAFIDGELRLLSFWDESSHFET